MSTFHKELEEDDPYELVALRLPAPAGWDAPAMMARTFIEEYALMGWSRPRIMQLFRSRAFAGTHAIYEERGEAYIAALIAEVFGPERAKRGSADAEGA